MNTTRKNVFGCAANFLRDKKCIFCGSFKVNRTSRGYVKCRSCHKQKSLKLLRTEIRIVTGFYQQQPAYRLASDLGSDYQAVTRVYQKLRLAIYHITELEGARDSRAKLKWTNHTLVVSVKVNVGEVRQVKALLLAS